MAKKTSPLLPVSLARLERLGERLRLARRRRRLTARQVAQRAGMAPMTLRAVERGGAGVTIGAYFSVMQVLGLDVDIDLLAETDTQGRKLQDARLAVAHGAATKQVTAVKPNAGVVTRDLPENWVPPLALTMRATRAVRAHDSDWQRKGGFASSAALAELLTVPRTGHRTKR
jgi:transcriptional regulator with XRE-family HTH domain